MFKGNLQMPLIHPEETLFNNQFAKEVILTGKGSMTSFFIYML